MGLFGDRKPLESRVLILEIKMKQLQCTHDDVRFEDDCGYRKVCNSCGAQLDTYFNRGAMLKAKAEYHEWAREEARLQLRNEAPPKSE